MTKKPTAKSAPKSTPKSTAVRPKLATSITAPAWQSRLRAAYEFVRRKPVGYWLLAAAWGFFAIRSYVQLAGSSQFKPHAPVEPHPIMTDEFVIDFGGALVYAVVPAVLVLLCLSTIFIIRAQRWRRLVLGVQFMLVLGLIAYMQATMLASHSAIQATPPARPLEQALVKRAQCGDAVQTVDNYNFGAHTFFELRDRGYRLAATYETGRGFLDNDTACATYYALRRDHRAEDIVLQIFTYDEHNTPQPYLYKYAGQDNVVYGIFVREQ